MIAQSVSRLWFDILPSIDTAPVVVIVKIVHDNSEAGVDVSEARSLNR